MKAHFGYALWAWLLAVFVSIGVFAGEPGEDPALERWSFRASDTFDGVSATATWRTEGRWLFDVGVLEGNGDLSPLLASPYVGAVYARNGTGWGGLEYEFRGGWYHSVLVYMEARGQIRTSQDTLGITYEEYMPVASFYASARKSIPIGADLENSVGISASYASGYIYNIIPMVNPEFVVGESITWPLTGKDTLRLGASASGVIERGNVQNMNAFTYDIYTGENNAWIGWATDRFGPAVEIEAGYRRKIVLSEYFASVLCGGKDDVVRAGLEFSSQVSLHELFPDRDELSISLGYRTKNGLVDEVRLAGSTANVGYTYAESVRDWSLGVVLSGALWGIPASVEKEFFDRPSLVPAAFQPVWPSSLDIAHTARTVADLTYDEFIEDVIQKQDSLEALLYSLSTFGRLLYDHTYNDRIFDSVDFVYRDTIMNTISNEEMYNLLKVALSEDDRHIDGPVCTGISRFLAELVDLANIPGAGKAYVTHARTPRGPHEFVTIVMPDQIYILNGDWYLATGTHSLEVAYQLYQKYRGRSWTCHGIFEDGRYIGEQDTPDGRLIRKNMTVIGDESPSATMKRALRR